MDLITAIDLGSTKAACLMVDCQKETGARVVGFGSADCKGLKRGSIVDLTETAHAVATAVRRAETMAGAKAHNLVVSLSGTELSGQSAKGIIPIVPPGRAVTREDVNRVINHSKQIPFAHDRELIHAIPCKFRVDGHDGVKKPIGMSAERLEVSTFLISGPTTELQTLERCLGRAQLEIELVIVGPIASALGVLSQKQMDEGVLVVDIGGNVTEAAVYSDGALTHICIVPIGSNHISSDLSKLLKTTQEDAESLKREYGTCLPDSVAETDAIPVQQVGAEKPRPFSKRVFAEIIEARLRELITMIKQNVSSAGFFRDAGRIVITGGGSKLPGITKLFETEMDDASVQIGRPIPLGGLSDVAEGEQHAAVVGLVNYALHTREEDSVSAETRNGNWITKALDAILRPRERAQI